MEFIEVESENTREEPSVSRTKREKGEKLEKPALQLTTWRKIALEVDRTYYALTGEVYRENLQMSPGRGNTIVMLLRFRGEVLEKLKEARTIEQVERRYGELLEKYRDLQQEVQQAVGRRLQ